MVPGFSPVPLYDFLENADNNDLDERTCPYAQGSSKIISQDISSSYAKFNSHIEKLREPLIKMFNLNSTQIKKYNFKTAAIYSDTVVTRSFEGLNISETTQSLNKSLLEDFQKMNKFSQLNKYTTDAKQLWSTQMLEKPINIMDSIISQDFENLMSIYDNTDSLAQKVHTASNGLKGKKHRHNTKWVSHFAFDQIDHPKYMMYSSHDTQVGIIWEFLQPQNFDPSYIPYASFLQIELYKDQNCSTSMKVDANKG